MSNEDNEVGPAVRRDRARMQDRELPMTLTLQRTMALGIAMLFALVSASAQTGALTQAKPEALRFAVVDNDHLLTFRLTPNDPALPGWLTSDPIVAVRTL